MPTSSFEQQARAGFWSAFSNARAIRGLSGGRAAEWPLALTGWLRRRASAARIRFSPALPRRPCSRTWPGAFPAFLREWANVDGKSAPAATVGFIVPLWWPLVAPGLGVGTHAALGNVNRLCNYNLFSTFSWDCDRSAVQMASFLLLLPSPGRFYKRLYGDGLAQLLWRRPLPLLQPKYCQNRASALVCVQRKTLTAFWACLHAAL